MSLMRWTPFFWEQDRFGMLVPLLATPLAHPMANLLFQDFLDLWAGLAAFVLLSRFMLRDETYPAAASLAIAAFLTMAPAPYRFSYLVDACYGTWLAPAVGGLILLERGPKGVSSTRRLAAWGLIVLAHWQSIATSMYLGPLVLAKTAIEARHQAGRRRPIVIEGAEMILALAIGTVAGLAMMRLSPYHATAFGAAPMVRWPGFLRHLIGTTWSDLAPWGLPATMIVAALIGVIVARTRGVSLGPAARAAVALIAAGTATTLFLGTRSWMEINLFHHRYLLPSVIFATVGLAGLATAWIKAIPGRYAVRIVAAASASLLILGALIAYGTPSPSGVRRDLDGAIGRSTPDLIAARCTHVTGSFWNVWPAVYHARLVRFEGGDRTMTWGITHRCDPTRDLWMAVPVEETRLAIVRGDPEGQAWLRAYRLPPFVEVEKRATIRVLRPASAVPKSSSR